MLLYIYGESIWTFLFLNYLHFSVWRALSFTVFSLYKNGWDAQKQRPYRISGSTRCVARIAGGDKCGEVIWNEEFLKQFPQLEHFKTIRNQKGKLVFSELDNDDIKISLKDALSAKRYAAGATWVFDALIADTPLAKALKNTFPMYHTYKKVLFLEDVLPYYNCFMNLLFFTYCNVPPHQ